MAPAGQDGEDVAALGRMLRRSADANPAATAVVHGPRRLTYRALDAEADALEAGLRDLGAAAGDAVLVAMPSSPEFVALYFAVARLGGLFVGLSPRSSPGELDACLADFDPAVVIVDPQAETAVDRALERRGRRRPIVVVGGPRGRHLGIEDLRATPAPAPAAAGSGDFAVLYSSGSTGAPKAIVRSQASQLAEAEQIVRTAGITAADVVFSAVPLYHALGQFCCLLVAVRAAATLAIFHRGGPQGSGRALAGIAQDAAPLARAIAEHRASVMPAVPHIFEAMAATPGTWDLTCLRYCLSGSNFLTSETRQAFWDRFGVRIRQTYGTSEVGTVAWDCDPEPSQEEHCVGRPLRGVEVRIVAPDGDDRPGRVGEIAVRSPAAARATDLAPLGDGYLATGDLGRIDSSGRLHVVGRKSLVVDHAGHKVNLLEVEHVISAHPGVAEVGAVTVPQPDGSSLLTAFVVPCGHAVDAAAILAHCRERLAPHKVPQAVVFRPGLPRSPVGKIRRGELAGGAVSP